MTFACKFGSPPAAGMIADESQIGTIDKSKCTWMARFDQARKPPQGSNLARSDLQRVRARLRRSEACGLEAMFEPKVAEA
ncbi:MAG TPA: hypothetical protein VNS33_19995 [Bradyrhizobium sp.]|nr:hypothetical protein [Bradyrhizobium sp.]